MTTLAPGEKATELNEEAIRRSVVEERTPREGPAYGGNGVGGAAGMVWMVNQAASEIQPWGRNIKLRDRQLREFVPTEPMFASSLGTVISRNAAFSWNIEGDAPRTAAAMHDVLDSADDGQGWVDFVSKVSYDLYTQDSGAFVEFVRASDSENAPVIGLNHLDALRCFHTGIPQTPVLYIDRLGKSHMMPWYSVHTLAEMPTTYETFYGMQLCALSRLLRRVEIAKNIETYEWEKTGGRHARQINIVRGVPTTQLDEALEGMKVFADNAGLTRFMTPLIFGTVDPNVELQHIAIDLVSLPDGYNSEIEFKQYVAMIALAFFEDYQTFAPLPGGNLGTSAQSEILHGKSRGKGPGLFMKLFSQMMNQRVMPRNVEFVWEEQDPDAEDLAAKTKLVRAQERAARIQSGELSTTVARQIAVDEGDLTPDQLAQLGEEDSDENVRLEDDRPNDTQIIDPVEAARLAAIANQNSQPPPPATPPAPGGAPPNLLAAAGKAIELVTEHVGSGRKTQLGSFLQTRIHRAFTTAADDLAALGYMDTEGRILLSSIIGDSLRVFSELVDSEAADIARQELDRDDVRRLVEDVKALSLEEVNDERLDIEEKVGGQIGQVLGRLRKRVESQMRGEREKELASSTKPYSGPDDKTLPTNVRKMSAADRRQWVAVFNSAIRDGGDEGKAFAAANAAVKELAGVGTALGQALAPPPNLGISREIKRDAAGKIVEVIERPLLR